MLRTQRRTCTTSGVIVTYSINPDLVINNLLEKNKNQTLQISVLESAVAQLQDEIRRIRGTIDDQNTMDV